MDRYKQLPHMQNLYLLHLKIQKSHVAYLCMGTAIFLQRIQMCTDIIIEFFHRRQKKYWAWKKLLKHQKIKHFLLLIFKYWQYIDGIWWFMSLDLWFKCKFIFVIRKHKSKNVKDEIVSWHAQKCFVNSWKAVYIWTIVLRIKLTGADSCWKIIFISTLGPFSWLLTCKYRWSKNREQL